MQVSRHIHITGAALKQWFIGQCYDSACVGLLWWAGLTFLQVPFAIFWALLATLFQFIPQFGPVLSIIGPTHRGGFRQLGDRAVRADPLRRDRRGRRPSSCSR